MAFFKQFPKVEYDFNRQGVINNMIDIYRSVRPLQNFVDSTSAYTYYEVRNGERPDIVSRQLYGNQNFWVAIRSTRFVNIYYKCLKSMLFLFKQILLYKIFERRQLFIKLIH